MSAERIGVPRHLGTRRLSEGIGIALDGLDLSKPLLEGAFREVEQAFWDGQVLAIKHQTLTPAEFLAFARRFGKPEPHVIDTFHHPDAADILILTNRRRPDGSPGRSGGWRYLFPH